MLYQSMVLEFLEQCPQIYDRLRHSRTLRSTMERIAIELKTSHEAWRERLSRARPDGDPSQIGSEAMELALQEMADSLPTESPQNDDETFSLDQAIAFIRTPPA